MQRESERKGEQIETETDRRTGRSRERERELISTLKKKEKKTKAQAGNEWSKVFPKSSQARKKKPPHTERPGGTLLPDLRLHPESSRFRIQWVRSKINFLF